MVNILRVKKLIFRKADFLAIAEEHFCNSNVKKTDDVRYGFSEKHSRGIYTFKYKNITAFYVVNNEQDVYIAVEVDDEKYLLKIMPYEEEQYMAELSEKIEMWR